MYCRKCGAELREGATFCMKCGTKVTVEEPKQASRPPRPEHVSDNRNVEQPVSSDKNGTGKNLLPFILLGIVIIILAGVIIWLIMQKKDTSESNDKDYDVAEEVHRTQEDSDEAETQEEASTQIQSNSQSEETQPEETVQSQTETVSAEGDDSVLEDVYAKFGIGMYTTADYSANLNPDAYLSYHSGISDFYFSYPAYLYNYVEYSEEPWEKTYGRNIQDVLFTGSDGSQLEFMICQRTDGSSVEEMTNYVHETETGTLQEASVLQNTVKEDNGKVTVTGYDDTYTCLIYKVTKIEPDYVLEMTVTFPNYTSEEDKLQKDYITECMYRTCGFSGSSKLPQTYEEYQTYWENQ